ncbi:nitroreductase [Limoniibacter endophyticus]|uniref:Putative NAD(P)H nitroreductase n=2 Tax=Limoniibacter endophyticus TaxID=1565040 RepID=A0A8J3GEG1_9HYPH|nr:nitroreductase [Limoniibacter endophyticus]
MTDPGPSEQEIETLIRIASRVPDHGRLVPWRFILYRGDARLEIGEKLAALAVEREGELPQARLDQERQRFARAPLVIGIVFCPRESIKIPQWEMFLSGGASAMNLLTAASAMGYGAAWITNWYSDDEKGRAILGLAPEERVVGFVHIGNYDGSNADRPRPELDAIVSNYTGPYAGAK